MSVFWQFQMGIIQTHLDFLKNLAIIWTFNNNF